MSALACARLVLAGRRDAERGAQAPDPDAGMIVERARRALAAGAGDPPRSTEALARALAESLVRRMGAVSEAAPPTYRLEVTGRADPLENAAAVREAMILLHARERVSLLVETRGGGDGLASLRDVPVPFAVDVRVPLAEASARPDPARSVVLAAADLREQRGVLVTISLEVDGAPGAVCPAPLAGLLAAARLAARCPRGAAAPLVAAGVELVEEPEWPAPGGAGRVLLLSLATACGCDCVFCGLPQVERHTVMDAGLLEAALVGHPAGEPWEEINITGGDPLLLPPARRLFRTLGLRRAHFARASVCTAGVPSRPALEGLRALLDAIGDVTVYVSLDGVGELHDRVRGRAGAFAEVERFIEGARPWVKRLLLHTVIHAHNAEHLGEVIEWAGARELPVMFGVANRTDHYLVNVDKIGEAGPTPEAARAALSRLAAAGASINMDAFAPALGQRRERPCRLLDEGVLVTSDGDIAICGGGRRMVLSTSAPDDPPAARWARSLRKRRDVAASEARATCARCSYLW